MRPLPLLCLAALGAFASAQTPQAPEAQATAKQPLLAKDYGQWESLRGSGTLSPDGLWLSYNVSRASGNNELRLADIGKNERVVFANATSARFTDDSLMLGYLIGVSPDKLEKMKKDKKPVRTKFALRELSSGDTVTIEGVSAFSFSKDGKHVALKRFQKTGQKKGGADLVVRDLATGAEMCFGNIGSYEWSEEANLLAMIVDTEDKVGGSVTVLHADTGVLRVLDSHKARYTGLSWRDDATDVAFLRITDHKSEDDEQPSHVVIAWRGLGTNNAKKTVYDHREEPEFPAGMRVVSQSPSWHKNGDGVFFGIRPWDVKPAAKVKPEGIGQTRPTHPTAQPHIVVVTTPAAAQISPAFDHVRVTAGAIPHHQRSTTVPRADLPRVRSRGRSRGRGTTDRERWPSSARGPQCTPDHTKTSRHSPRVRR